MGARRCLLSYHMQVELVVRIRETKDLVDVVECFLTRSRGKQVL